MKLILYNGAYNGPQIDAAISRALSGGEIDQRIGQVAALISAPTVAATAAAMTDTAKIYIYTGSEAGYNTGHWYYWDGAAWADGGAYQAAAADNALSPTSENAVQNKVINAAIDAAKAEAFAAVYEAYPTATIEDAAVASFTDGADGIPVKAMTVDVDPAQAAGIPSPDNPLAISGWTGANIVVSPTQDAADGTTYIVDWQTEAGTIFGGTLTDNGDGTWTLSVTFSIVDLGTLSWEYYAGRAYFLAALPSDSAPAATTSLPGRCSCYPVMETSSNTEFYNSDKTLIYSKSGISSQKRVYIRDDDFTENTLENFVASLSGQQLVYQRQIPLVYTLSAESVKTRLGDNNIWSDTGDVAELTYRADPTLFINS